MLVCLVVVMIVITRNSVFAAQRGSPVVTGDKISSSSSSSESKNYNSDSYTYRITNGYENSNVNNLNSHGSFKHSTSSTATFPATKRLTTPVTRPSFGSSDFHRDMHSYLNEVLEDVHNGPYFDRAASKNVTALLGKTAYLNCRVKNIGNKTMVLQVSWVRHRDIHLLTVGRYTYTSDQRFRAIHQPQTEDWILQIKYPQHRDSGIYECQVSTVSHMSHFVHLNVIEPSTSIVGAPDLYIESGSTINLTCIILNSPEPPAYIYWNHNNAIISYDSPRGGVSVVTNKGDISTSILLIRLARSADSGHYQCNPSNAKSESVMVHVLNGEFPAAMQHSPQSHNRLSLCQCIFIYLFVYLLTLAYVRRNFAALPKVGIENVGLSF